MELPVYEAYRSTVRPLEEIICKVAPALLSSENVVVGRVPTKSGRLSVTIGMLTMDEEQSIERMIGEIRAAAPDAKILIVDSSMKNQTPFIAERLGARVLRQLPPRGHGPAMELLMYEAAKETDALIYLDCDFTYPPSVIPQHSEDSGGRRRRRECFADAPRAPMRCRCRTTSPIAPSR